MKKTKIILCIILSVVLLSTGILFSVNIHKENKIKSIESTVYNIPANYKELNVDYYSGIMAFPTGDLKIRVGYVDYVFVGRVDEIVGTTYTDAFYKENGELSCTPWTNYKVTVLECIKGELETGISIPFKQRGGVNIDKSSSTFATDNFYLQPSGIYMFTAYVNSEGELYASSAEDNVLLGNINSDLQSTNPVQSYTSFCADKNTDNFIDKYKDAYQNQDQSYKLWADKICNHDKRITK